MPWTSYDLADRWTQLTHNEIEFLKDITHCLPINGTFVNIGAGHGTSAMAITEARQDIRIITLDKVEDGPTGSLKGERDSFYDWVLAGTYKQPLQILGDSAESGLTWQGGPVDAVFIDGDHTLIGCKADYYAWEKHVNPGGYILFHDYKSVYGPGVFATVEEVEKELELVGLVDTLIAYRKPNNGN